MGENEEKRLERNKSRTKSAISLLALLFLAGLIIYNHKEPINKVYSTTFFYQGRYNEPNANPKEVYALMQGSGVSSGTGQCKKEKPDKATENKTFPGTNGNIWPTTEDPDDLTSETIVSTYAIDPLHPERLYLWKDAESKEIISPFASFYFDNFNGATSSNTTIKIKAEKDGDYVVTFYNVKNWFCCINESTTTVMHSIDTRHTCPDELIGGPYIIGMATSDTYVVVEENGLSEHPLSLVEFLTGSGEN